ncbi:MAG: hypothetical protein JWM09_1571 [Francisellaceae bacterium]|nr:hypothetical protein [Francisellaceae bacterium]
MCAVGEYAHFLFKEIRLGFTLMVRDLRLEKMISPIIQGLGFTFEGLEYIPQKRSILRIFLGKDGGVNVDDCQAVSRHISLFLDVEDGIKGEYILEVSSPGLDRLLLSKEHYVQQLGKEISVNVKASLNGHKHFKGILDSVLENEICIAVGDEKVVLSLDNIREARLVPKF